MFMKKLKLLFAALVATTALSAQNSKDEYTPEVYAMWKMSPSGNITAINEVIELYKTTHVEGFKQSQMPQFILTTRDNRFMLGIGGFANFRTAYDFDGNVGNTDFVTYNIPIQGNYATHQQLRLDASTSRLFFKAMAKTKALGNITAYIETDFRGYEHNLRLRLAYISFKGWLFGQNVTTFCDLTASPTTIDFEGPNAYTWNYSTMIRYTHAFSPKWSIGAAIEAPQISATETATLKTIPQRIPDIPMYIQFNWDKNHGSHLRLSGVFRDLFYHDKADNKTKSTIGWGAQLSTRIALGDKFTFTGETVYGRGITPYIQDISGSGLDLVPNPENNTDLQTVPMMGWFGTLQYNISKNIFCSGGYSQVSVFKSKGYSTPSQYRLAQYAFVNAFWNITPSCQVGIEYLYGTRKNMNNDMNHANRLQAAIQYNF